MKYDPAGAIAQTAQNVGQFATDRALADESMRQQAFANDQSRQAASFALGGLGQAFNQRQQVQEQDFRQQQADVANNFRQQDLDQQNQYRNDSLAERAYAAQAANQGRYDVAGLNGQNRLQGIYAQQQGADDRNDEDNQVKLLLQQNGQDWRTADHATVQAAREHIQQMRGQQGQDLEQLRFQNRGALQDDQQDFVGGQNDLNRQQRQSQFDQRRQDQQANPAAGYRGAMGNWNGQRIMLSTQASLTMNQLHALQQQAKESIRDPNDPLGRNRLPTQRALEAQQQIPPLMQRLDQLQQQLVGMGSPPDINQLYGQQQFTDAPDFTPADLTQMGLGDVQQTAPAPAAPPSPQAAAAAQQMVATLKAQAQAQGLNPDDPQVKARIRAVVAQQFQAQ